MGKLSKYATSSSGYLGLLCFRHTVITGNAVHMFADNLLYSKIL